MKLPNLPYYSLSIIIGVPLGILLVNLAFQYLSIEQMFPVMIGLFLLAGGAIVLTIIDDVKEWHKTIYVRRVDVDRRTPP